MLVVAVYNIAICLQRNIPGSLFFTKGPDTVVCGNTAIRIQIFQRKVISYHQQLFR